MIQKTTIAVALGTVMLGMLPASAADFRVPPGPQYGAPPQYYPPPARYGYVPAPVYAPRVVVVAPQPYYEPYYQPYYVRPGYAYPRYGAYPQYGYGAYPRYGAYPQYNVRVNRPYVAGYYGRGGGPGYRRW
jgi:hypothetical protein